MSWTVDLVLDEPRLEDLLRILAPQVLGAVVRHYGNFDTAEDAVQEALAEAATQWQAGELPDHPKGWLVTVASRRMADLLRQEQARRRREERAASWALPQPPSSDVRGDDTLIVLFMCCHPALSSASQIALTLRAVGGLTTEEVARAFLVPVSTMTRRITRAKQAIMDAGATFRMPSESEIEDRLRALLHVLYLIFNEGYAATSGPRLYREELTSDAIRLARLVHDRFPDEPEVGGLLALMLLTDARRPARMTPDGSLVPLMEQDRTLWDQAKIEEGTSILSITLPRGRPGPYQLQAAIAALHDEAPTPDETDWVQIAALYEGLLEISDSPLVRLNRVVAIAHVDGPKAALSLATRLSGDRHLQNDHRVHSVRGHLFKMIGETGKAIAAFETAARLATNPAHQRYLYGTVNRLRDIDKNNRSDE